MIKYSAIEILSKAPPRKIKRVWHLLQQSVRNMYYSAPTSILCALLIGLHKPVALINFFDAFTVEPVKS